MKRIPLAERLRPTSFKEIVGQEHLIGSKGFITHLIKNKTPLSLILWGPPGSGKTSIAHLYAQAFGLRFESLSPIFSGVGDLRKLLQDIEPEETLLLFVDEIHRFNKAQQDAFLPSLESGKLTIVGSTIENPSFYLTQALLSRVQVLSVLPLTEQALRKILHRYESMFQPLNLSEEAIHYLIQLAHGDGRYLLNLIETISTCKKPLDIKSLQKFLQEKAPLFDKNTDQHYNLISAFHKSVRGSDPDAALYWYARMVIAGEDPLYIARRCIRIASEDIGVADPQALTLSIAARDAYQMLGTPEGELALAELVIYLAMAPKSNASYTAFSQAIESALATSHLSPPLHILNAPTPLMKKMGYGKGYVYDHSTPEGFSGQNYFPEGMKPPSFYHPTQRGYEVEIHKRLHHFKSIRSKK